MKKVVQGFVIIVITAVVLSFSKAVVNIVNITQFGKPGIEISTGTVVSGDLLYTILKREKVNERDTVLALKELGKIYRLSSSRPGDTYKIVRTTYSTLIGFEYVNNLDIYRIIKSTTGVFSSSKTKLTMQRRIVGVKGRLNNSLWESMSAQSVPPEQIIVFADDIFAWNIDFFTEPRKGDSYVIIWERYESDDGKKVDGKVLYAQYNGLTAGDCTAVRFMDSYYDPKGKSLRRAFLRAPLNYRRISSYFSKARFHPILRYYRPHLGIDYAAPQGTPVVSIGDGFITHAGWRGQGGKTVVVKHNSVYTSSYCHFARIPGNVRSGNRVKQGQVIGYVGTTGLSTGPHLDFRIMQNGKLINFLKLKIPPARSISSEKMQEFEIERQKWQGLCQLLENDKTIKKLE
ncbi:MAG: peptidoglycan DD-metalloendopeptidase family protein [Elusimicrobiota bacterium]